MTLSDGRGPADPRESEIPGGALALTAHHDPSPVIAHCAPFQWWRKMLTAALHFLVASGQPTAHVTRPAFSMPAVALPLTMSP